MDGPIPGASEGTQTGSLIAGYYSADMNRPMVAGGLPGFVVGDVRDGTRVLALQTLPYAPPRARMLSALATSANPGLLHPLAHGAGPADGSRAYYVLTPLPPGPSLAPVPGARPWAERELLDCVLRPVAAVLEALQARHVTHRAIRPDNLFRAGPGTPVVLGCGWAAPPAYFQPPLFEPPYAALCAPGARGDGSIADDVYALGVTLLVLALGQAPLVGLDDAAIIHRKLELGSFAALTEGAVLPPLLADLLRGMLAEDPQHRPLPSLLHDPHGARARRLATRAPARAQRPLHLGGAAIWDARTLAFGIMRDPGEGARLLRSGAVDHWLRRGLGDAGLAGRLTELLRHHSGEAGTASPHAQARSDSLLALRAVALLDPLAPLCWRGMALWPDGLGAALAEARAYGPDYLAPYEELLDADAVGAWALARPGVSDVVALRREANQHRLALKARGLDSGLPRLLYGLNPLLACQSPLLAGRCVVRLADLLSALEEASASAEIRAQPPMDADIAAFVAARRDQVSDGPSVSGVEDRPATRALAILRMLAPLQGSVPLPALAAWIAAHTGPLIEEWHNRGRRSAVETELARLRDAGFLMPMLSLLDDPTSRHADAQGLLAARQRIEAIDRELARIAGGQAARTESARRIGHEVATGTGLAALALVLVMAVLG